MKGLPDASVDLAILSQALHHAQRPEVAVAEAYRILRPGGQLLVLDLNEHTFAKARELYADVWLGFKESALHGFLLDKYTLLGQCVLDLLESSDHGLAICRDGLVIARARPLDLRGRIHTIGHVSSTSRAWRA